MYPDQTAPKGAWVHIICNIDLGQKAVNKSTLLLPSGGMIVMSNNKLSAASQSRLV